MIGSDRQAGRPINLPIYAWRSPPMFDKEAKFNFLLQALNPRPASRACNLPTAWLSLGQLHRPMLKAKLARGRGQSKATGHLPWVGMVPDVFWGRLRSPSPPPLHWRGHYRDN